MNLDAAYVKDLQIFLSVVDANGIANAQAKLNKDASTISRSISSLETRLGLRLCDRGRQGFKLTSEGRVLADEAIKLFSSFRTFENRIEGIGGKGAGTLAIGVIDNIITDPNCRLDKTIGEISIYFKNRLHIDVLVNNPYDLEKYLLDKRIDIAIGIFENRHDSICYTLLYKETDYLYCSPDNPVAKSIREKADQSEILTLLKSQKFAARTFLNEGDVHDVGFQILGELSFSSNLEAIAFMLLSGQFVGFLPAHYAQRYVDADRLQPILANSIYRTSNIEVAHRKNEEQTRIIIAKFLEIMGNS